MASFIRWKRSRPSGWSEGGEVVVAAEPRPHPGEIDRWCEELQAAAAGIAGMTETAMGSVDHGRFRPFCG